MEFLREAYRKIKGEVDPRDREIRDSVEALHNKFEDLCGPALGHVFVDLSHTQAEQILPQADDVSGINIHIVLFGERMYTCSLGQKETAPMFVLDNQTARISRYIRREGMRPAFDRYKVIDLERKNADEKDRNLQALQFGHRFVDVLLEVKRISPEALFYS